MPDVTGAHDLSQPPPPAAPPQQPGQPQLANPGLVARYRELTALAERNVTTLKQLAMEHQAGIDPRTIMEMRLSILLDMLFDLSSEAGQAGRIEYDMRFEQAMETMLSEVLGQVGQARLAAGTQLSPEQMDALSKSATNLAGLIKPNGQRRPR